MDAMEKMYIKDTKALADEVKALKKELGKYKSAAGKDVPDRKSKRNQIRHV